MSIQAFEDALAQQVNAFVLIATCRKVDEGTFRLADYHAILTMVFHQVFESSSSLALAAAQCGPGHYEAKAYLMHHADEEKSHWQWVLNDLEKTGYSGSDPRSTFPPPACLTYVAFNYYTSLRHPIDRLAIAAMLESLGASHGKAYATKICRHLKLPADQAQFFFGHGDTDVGHTRDILNVLAASGLTKTDYDRMTNTVVVAGTLYRAMYDAVG